MTSKRYSFGGFIGLQRQLDAALNRYDIRRPVQRYWPLAQFFAKNTLTNARCINFIICWRLLTATKSPSVTIARRLVCGFDSDQTRQADAPHHAVVPGCPFSTACRVIILIFV